MTLLTNRLTPTPEQINDWLQSPRINQWLKKLPMGITDDLKIEAIISNSQFAIRNSQFAIRNSQLLPHT